MTAADAARVVSSLAATLVGVLAGWVVADLVTVDLGPLDCSEILSLEPFPPAIGLTFAVLAIAAVVLWRRLRVIAWGAACSAATSHGLEPVAGGRADATMPCGHAAWNW